MSLHNYKLCIAYDGTNYNGWQVQANGITIQGIIQDAIQTITKHKTVVIGSGRTDAGVHALGQVAHFKIPCELELWRFQASLNGVLPRDIRVKEIQKVPLKFHAQYQAAGKTYHYHIHLERVMNPFKRLYCTHVHTPFDEDLFREAAVYFLRDS
jgi:tRNA pseudouridine38-40 synthase